jgi:NAD(P)-dependent dehydrogenase (short-subunit alcohol dehydrogenase family)
MRFPDRESAVSWYNSPEYQQLIDIRSVAMDARFGLLDGLRGSVRASLAAINGSVDALVMNAGVIGGERSMDLTADGVTTVFATNVLGHVVLLEGLLKGKLYDGCSAGGRVPP